MKRMVAVIPILIGLAPVFADCPDARMICPGGEELGVSLCFNFKHMQCETCRSIDYYIQNQCELPALNACNDPSCDHGWFRLRDGMPPILPSFLHEIFHGSETILKLCYATGRPQSACLDEFNRNMKATCGMPGVAMAALDLFNAVGKAKNAGEIAAKKTRKEVAGAARDAALEEVLEQLFEVLDINVCTVTAAVNKAAVGELTDVHYRQGQQFLAAHSKRGHLPIDPTLLDPGPSPDEQRYLAQIERDRRMAELEARSTLAQADFTSESDEGLTLGYKSKTIKWAGTLMGRTELRTGQSLTVRVKSTEGQDCDWHESVVVEDPIVLSPREHAANAGGNQWKIDAVRPGESILAFKCKDEDWVLVLTATVSGTAPEVDPATTRLPPVDPAPVLETPAVHLRPAPVQPHHVAVGGDPAPGTEPDPVLGAPNTGRIATHVRCNEFKGLDGKSHEGTIEIGLGDTLGVNLCAADWMGCDWSDRAVVDDRNVLQQRDHKDLSKSKLKLRFAPMEHWMFGSVAMGDAVIDLTCNPTAGDPDQARTYRLRVKVGEMRRSDPPPPPTPRTITLGANDDGATFAMNVGERLEIVLDSNPTTGFQWQIAENSDRAVLQESGREYLADPAPPGMVGSGGKDVWRFAAARPGTVQLRLEYRRPWDQEAQGTRTFRVAVAVK